MLGASEVGVLCEREREREREREPVLAGDEDGPSYSSRPSGRVPYLIYIYTLFPTPIPNPGARATPFLSHSYKVVIKVERT